LPAPLARCFVASGIGITPVLGFLRELSAVSAVQQLQPTSATWPRGTSRDGVELWDLAAGPASTALSMPPESPPRGRIVLLWAIRFAADLRLLAPAFGACRQALAARGVELAVHVYVTQEDPPPTLAAECNVLVFAGKPVYNDFVAAFASQIPSAAGAPAPLVYVYGPATTTHPTWDVCARHGLRCIRENFEF
jgi:hypothetical protein